ncbi:glycosyltransferase family 1 protein, partial [Streptomyces sp. SID10244]|nr:glycosyltransferase family 1 protein [Streptomyces sp. SID10244]
ATTEITLAPGPHETFCLSALESLASGTPVVASTSSAVAGMVDASCGALAANSPAAFADAIEQVLALPRPERESAARQRASGYRWPDSIARMLAVHRG